MSGHKKIVTEKALFKTGLFVIGLYSRAMKSAICFKITTHMSRRYLVNL